MPEKIAQMLLMHVFYTVSAVVSIGESGEIRCIKMFDTVYGGAYMHADAASKELWLLTNHPEGQPGLYEADRKNLQMLQAVVPAAKVRVFVVNEDVGCTEIDMSAKGTKKDA